MKQKQETSYTTQKNMGEWIENWDLRDTRYIKCSLAPRRLALHRTPNLLPAENIQCAGQVNIRWACRTKSGRTLGYILPALAGHCLCQYFFTRTVFFEITETADSLEIELIISQLFRSIRLIPLTNLSQ